MFRSTDYNSNATFKRYMDRVGGQFCPFLPASMKKQSLFLTDYIMMSPNLNELEEMIFYFGLIHTEILREHRSDAPQDKSLLACENLIFTLPDDLNDKAEELLAWPHWCLKSLYTQKGVLFGKFWKGEKELSQGGEKIPEPVEHFLSIRSIIKKKDHRFFNKAPDLVKDFNAAYDDGGDVIKDISFEASKEIAKLKKKFNQNSLKQSDIYNAVSVLKEHDVYKKTLKRVQA